MDLVMMMVVVAIQGSLIWHEMRGARSGQKHNLKSSYPLVRSGRERKQAIRGGRFFGFSVVLWEEQRRRQRRRRPRPRQPPPNNVNVAEFCALRWACSGWSGYLPGVFGEIEGISVGIRDLTLISGVFWGISSSKPQITPQKSPSPRNQPTMFARNLK